jgi:periplasmic divalent cation tolerance protein
MIVYCTVPSVEVAEAISKALVMEKLCACVTQIPQVKSYYVYEGEFCEDDELLLMIKTATSHYDRLEKRLLQLHPYDTPEIIATPIVEGSQEYLSWLSHSLS